MSDDGEIRERLQRLGLELRQERNQGFEPDLSSPFVRFDLDGMGCVPG